MNDDMKREKRLGIARAALSVFEEKGFAQTRVDDICREAGIAKGTYYLYFSSKEEVLLSFLSDFQPVKGAEHDPRIDDAIGEAVAMIGGILEQGKARLSIVPLFWEVAGDQIVQSKCDLNTKLDALFSGIAAALASVIEKGQRDGAVSRSVNADAFAQTIVNSVDGIILHAAIFSKTAMNTSTRSGTSCCRWSRGIYNRSNLRIFHEEDLWKSMEAQRVPRRKRRCW
jgi:TetR/AcrR family fatty acid metabolism transcriptional regulator